MTLMPLPDFVLKPLVETALSEDLGHAGDITTDALIPKSSMGQAALNARADGVVAGMDLARLAFETFDPQVVFTAYKKDGEPVRQGDCLARISGASRSLLTAERTSLNFLCHLSGIATATSRLIDAAKPHQANICCTRKTTPGLRGVEKYAVRAGGGSNHRFGLDDAILIKDNHLIAAGSIRVALERARNAVGHLVKIELEVDTLSQLDEAIALYQTLPIDAVLLDNMPIPMLKQAVERVEKRFVTEASGGITLSTIGLIAATGVDVISVGWITHSAPILDIGLDME